MDNKVLKFVSVLLKIIGVIIFVISLYLIFKLFSTIRSLGNGTLPPQISLYSIVSTQLGTFLQTAAGLLIYALGDLIVVITNIERNTREIEQNTKGLRPKEMMPEPEPRKEEADTNLPPPPPSETHIPE